MPSLGHDDFSFVLLNAELRLAFPQRPGARPLKRRLWAHRRDRGLCTSGPYVTIILPDPSPWFVGGGGGGFLAPSCPSWFILLVPLTDQNFEGPQLWDSLPAFSRRLQVSGRQALAQNIEPARITIEEIF